MELLNRIFKEDSFKQRFDFHPKCEKDEIVYLCFADDLIIFSEATIASLMTVRAALRSFSDLTGLVPNVLKSSIFFSRVDDEIKTVLKHLLGFPEGTLLMRYLGVPLITTTLKATNCKSLTDKIVERNNAWINKTLSFAGRLQLIKSVLFGMQVY